ncbi:MAG: hypothetical protein K8J09_02030 [Planctomycetes bacterium]|nr:hypothetical protein [Planctomycetota bacterium]
MARAMQSSERNVGSEPSPARVLVSLVGAPGAASKDSEGGYQDRKYHLDGGDNLRTWCCAEVMAQNYGFTKQDGVVLLATDKSKDRVPKIRERLTRFGCAVTTCLLPVTGPDGGRIDKIGGDLRDRIGEVATGPASVFLDITTGQRSDGFLALMLLEFLAAQDCIRLETVCYAEVVNGDEFRVAGLRELRVAQRIAHAARDLKLAGRFSNLSEVAADLESGRRRRGNLPQNVVVARKHVVDALTEVGHQLEAGALPGIQRSLVKAAATFEKSAAKCTNEDLCVRALREALTALVPVGTSPMSEREGPDIDLAKRVMQWYVDRQNHDVALFVAAETVTSRLMLELGRGAAWTKRRQREPVGRFLGSLLKEGKSGAMAPTIKSFVDGFRRIGDCRNKFAHCFTSEGLEAVAALKQSREHVQQVLAMLDDAALWRQLARKFGEWHAANP